MPPYSDKFSYLVGYDDVVLFSFNFAQHPVAHRFDVLRYSLTNMEFCDFCKTVIQRLPVTKRLDGQKIWDDTSWLLEKEISFRRTSSFCHLCEFLVEVLPEAAIDEVPLSLLLIVDYTEDFNHEKGAHFGPFPSRVATSFRLDRLDWEHNDHVVLSLWADPGAFAPS